MFNTHPSSFFSQYLSYLCIALIIIVNVLYLLCDNRFYFPRAVNNMHLWNSRNKKKKLVIDSMLSYTYAM
jgi:hypothetical protein